MADWDVHHPPGPDGIPIRLYTDEDPATTIKGMGFKDAAAAERTIALARQPGAKYKTYWSVRAMAERARRHPSQTNGIRAALQTFDLFLADHDAAALEPTSEEAKSERSQRSLLAATRANAHALSRCASAEEFNRFASEDRADALRRLKSAANAVAGRDFVLPATSFVSLFGGPARHGYGEHACVQARSLGLPSFRCVCSMEGEHEITVTSAADLLGGASNFRWPSFQLSVSLDGEQSRARLVPTPPPGQPTLNAMMSVAAPLSAAPAASPPPPAEPAAPAHLHVVLLRRDLRTDDQPALARAAAAASAHPRHRLIVCYVYDPLLLRHPTASTAHYYFIDDCLAEIESALEQRGSALVLRSGELSGVLESFRRLPFQSMTLWSNRVVGVAAERRRDARMREWCAELGIAWHDLPSNGVVPRELLASSDDWHTEHFQMVWAHEMEEHCSSEIEPLPPISNQQPLPPPPEGLRRGARLSIEAIGRLGASTEHGIARGRCLRGGSTEGRKLLRSFLNTRGYGYRSKLSSPVTAADSCSRLSPHLAWGSLSLREVHHALRERVVALAKQSGARAREWEVCLEGFRMRLHWRSHNVQKFEAIPQVEHANVMRGYDGMRDEAQQDDDDLRRLPPPPPVPSPSASSADAAAVASHHPITSLGATEQLSPAELERRFGLWAAGRTGYPLVDACMRCLDATGWLTFRMRCLCVSFACYHLWLHWRRPAIWLARRFVDFEPGIHFCQMQMQAGCAEYVEMRVYNPIKQAAEQDPEGKFIREWLPELREVPLQYLHEPSRMPKAAQREAGCALGVDYPRPVVEHAVAYERAKRMLQERRHAMGWGKRDKGGRKAAAGSAGGDGTRDIRSLLGEKRARDDAPSHEEWEEAVKEAALHGASPTIAQSQEGHQPTPAPASSSVQRTDDDSVPPEMRTRAQLVAAGFPAEVARRAASAYPTDVERAADWILTSNEW